LTAQVVRSSARIPKEIPILLIGSDLDGRMFSERAATVLLSLHGAGVLSRHKLSPEQDSVGFGTQQLGFKVLNEISWVKPNPPPNLSRRYFTHATETIIWAAKNSK